MTQLIDIDARALRVLMDERDKRYEQRFLDQERAAKLALEAINLHQGRAQTVLNTVLSIIAIAISCFALFRVAP